MESLSPSEIVLSCPNEERFSLTGAAHEPLREDSIGGFRAGERKTLFIRMPKAVPNVDLRYIFLS